jgi:putative hydrolase of the HAD superfamily
VTPRLRAVLFDAVGTLIHLREPVGRSYGRIAHAHGVTLPADRLDEAFRRILPKAPPMAFPGRSTGRVRELERRWWWSRVRETFRATDQTARFADFDAFFDEVFAWFGSGDAWRAADAAAETLAALRADGLRLAVASNFDHRLPFVLQDLGLHRFFDLVWGPAQAGTAKPAPAFFTGLCDVLDVAPEATLHVGDDPDEDAAGARAAGLRAWIIEPPATLADLPARLRAEAPGARDDA